MPVSVHVPVGNSRWKDGFVGVGVLVVVAEVLVVVAGVFVVVARIDVLVLEGPFCVVLVVVVVDGIGLGCCFPLAPYKALVSMHPKASWS